jgi:hypothetical protein
MWPVCSLLIVRDQEIADRGKRSPVVLEILDRYVYKTVAEQRVERLHASMRPSRHASSARRAVAAALLKAGRRLDPGAARHAPCPDAVPSRP